MIRISSYTVETAVSYYWVATKNGMDYWNETLDWTTGLSHFPFLDKFLYLFLEAYIFLKFTSIWLLWMIVIMTIVDYRSVFINKSKYILENAVYCKLSAAGKVLWFLTN